MNKFLPALSAIMLSLALNSVAQTCGILLYNDNGKKFTVYTNGNRQNAQPMSEIKLCCFPMDIVKVKLEFEDKTAIEKTLYLRIGFIEHHKVTDKKIVFDSYEEMEPQYKGITQVTMVNINTGASGGNQQYQNTTVTTSTTNGRACSSPIADRSYYEFYGALKNKKFDSDRLTEAKNAVKRDCFTSKQIKNTLAVFAFESSRLEFAKFAYDFVYDRGAYSTVKGGFSNSISGDELEEYISKR